MKMQESYLFARDKNIYSMLIAVLPILGSYSFPFFPRLDVGTIALIVAVFFNFNKEFSVRFKPIVVVIIWTILSTIGALLTRVYFPAIYLVESDIVLFRVLKFGLMLFLVFGPCDFWNFNVKSCMNAVKWVVRASCLLLLLQQSAYIFFHYIVSNPLLYFLSISGGGTMESGYYVLSNGLFRPSAFFLEPSWAAIYTTVYLVYVLFSNEDDVKMIDKVIAFLTVFLTTSGIGILVASFILFFWVFFHRHKFIDVSFALIMIAGVFFLKNVNFINESINRFMYQENVVSGRSGFGYELFQNLPFVNKLFGNGLGYVPQGQFLNGMEYLLITLGGVGTTIVLLCFFYMVLKSSGWQKIVLLCWIILCFAAQVYSVTTIIFYVSIGYPCVYNDVRRKVLFGECKAKSLNSIQN